MLVKRRELLIFLGATLLAPAALALPAERHAVTVGSGGRGIFVTGSLSWGSAHHAAAIDALRAATGYWRRLRYSSTDPKKAGFATALAEHFVASRDLTFTAVVRAAAGPLPPRPAGDAAFTDAAPFVELGSFLAGCVYAQAANSAHPLKRDLAAMTLARLSGTGRFAVRNLVA